MKVGIITFHWATNYGAVLQSYALQNAIDDMGVSVEIINYKPTKYDNNLLRFLLNRKYMHPFKYIADKIKEKKIEKFRKDYLKQSIRYKSLDELREKCNNYNILITGSDQVMNPYFLQYGEKGGSTAYFLDFGNPMTVKIAYATSFGTKEYPKSLISKVSNLIKRFNATSSRENSGIRILEQMGADNPVLMPDPTLLHTRSFYDKLLEGYDKMEAKCRGYFLRGRERHLSFNLNDFDISLINEESIEIWLNSVRCSSFFITNSFHGVVFCILYHIPFIVILESTENIGMNDRFYSLLTPLGLLDRISSEQTFRLSSEKKESIDWATVDIRLNEMRMRGLSFIKQSLNIPDNNK